MNPIFNSELSFKLTCTEWNQPKTTIDISKTNDHKSVFDKIFQDIFHENGKFNIKAIGHRVVHGGDYFKVNTYKKNTKNK